MIEKSLKKLIAFTENNQPNAYSRQNMENEGIDIDITKYPHGSLKNIPKNWKKVLSAFTAKKLEDEGFDFFEYIESTIEHVEDAHIDPYSEEHYDYIVDEFSKAFLTYELLRAVLERAAKNTDLVEWDRYLLEMLADSDTDAVEILVKNCQDTSSFFADIPRMIKEEVESTTDKEDLFDKAISDLSGHGPSRLSYMYQHFFPGDYERLFERVSRFLSTTVDEYDEDDDEYTQGHLNESLDEILNDISMYDRLSFATPDAQVANALVFTLCPPALSIRLDDAAYIASRLHGIDAFERSFVDLIENALGQNENYYLDDLLFDELYRGTRATLLPHDEIKLIAELDTVLFNSEIEDRYPYDKEALEARKEIVASGPYEDRIVYEPNHPDFRDVYLVDLTPGEMVDEGSFESHRMNHCIGTPEQGHIGNVKLGTHKAFSVRRKPKKKYPKGKSLFTIKAKIDANGVVQSIDQIKGRANRQPGYEIVGKEGGWHSQTAPKRKLGEVDLLAKIIKEYFELDPSEVQDMRNGLKLLAEKQKADKEKQLERQKRAKERRDNPAQEHYSYDYSDFLSLPKAPRTIKVDGSCKI